MRRVIIKNSLQVNTFFIKRLYYLRMFILREGALNVLTLKKIVKDYSAGGSVVQALKGVDIEFRENEFVSILGQSGCGKTTLLNIIGGLDRYTSGDLVINGKSTKDFTAHDWDAYRNNSIGFVFQSYNLIPHQTVLSNVELALTLSGVSKAERKKRAIEALEKVGLGDQLHKKPNQMSGGQMQRVAIARAIVNNPDILLADEPTGALDSETSVQVMEILKEIAKDKLIIMVTHNPELAEKYSTRIIRLLDGTVVDDTNPYTAEKKAPQAKDKKEERKAKKKKKKSMSIFTALSLSLNNLMTKKARTFMTSFAGSIGIIGIALILSISNGVQLYISSTEEDTLSSYPLEIQSQTMDVSSMMMSMMGEELPQEHELDKIYSNNVMGKMMNTLMSEVKENNLEAFKKYIENPENGFDKELVSDIKYSYSTQMNIYKADTSDEILRVNPNALFETMGMQTIKQEDGTMQGTMMSMSPMVQDTDVWEELHSNKDLLNKQYDVVAGHMPEKYNEVVIVVDKNNEISDMALYSLGLLDTDELKDIMKKNADGEKTIETKQVVYTYDELLALKFKMLVNTDYYEKADGKWIDRSQNKSYMKKAIDNGTEIQVVGIIRPSEDSAIGDVTGFIGYTPELMKHLIEQVNASEIVKEQKANPDTDVFTGVDFPKEDEKEAEEDAPQTMEELQEYIAALPQQMQEQVTASIQQMQAAGMSEAQILAMMAESQKSETTTATYDGNLSILGVSDLAKPSAIKIYPKDFRSKEKITDKISIYNESVEENDKIQYTDYVGLMMSSVTTIINAISYILISFVAISLVVSSIMIGIITYISVLERTKEIGILRAIGASKRDISRVFNAETLIVGFVAGAIGIGVTLLLTIPINIIIEAITDIGGVAALPPVGGVVLVVISMLLTFIAGLIPSRIAAKKDPVVALRTE